MSVPVLSVARMRAWEQATWQTGQTESAVMARVGELVARRALALTTAGDRILILAGKGHNGDDARLSRPGLAQRESDLIEVTDPVHQLPELAAALARQPALIIDGLFGIGLNRPLDEGWKTFIDRVNQSRIVVLAVDAPSGLNCETGEAEGAAIKAGITLTLGAPKPGLLKPGAATFVGRLELADDIGLIPCPETSALHWTRPTDFTGFPPTRRMDAHKGDFGHLVIVAGSLGYHGAAVLAARGAQASRPGLVSVVTCDETCTPVASQLQSAMVRPWDSDWEPPGKTTAILFGPGLADATVPTGLRKQLVRLWQESPLMMIADATGLDWLPAPGARAPGVRVITPHPGEAARLLSKNSEQVQQDRPRAVRELSARLGDAWVVLKGQHTLVGRAGDEPVFLNPTGSPLLAQGGSGDVLAGFLGGLLAQPALQKDPLRAIRYAVWQHGLAGESPAWSGLIDDLPRELARPVAPAAG